MGPALMMEADDFLIEDLLRKNNIEEEYLEKLKGYFGQYTCNSSSEGYQLIRVAVYVSIPYIGCRISTVSGTDGIP